MPLSRHHIHVSDTRNGPSVSTDKGHRVKVGFTIWIGPTPHTGSLDSLALDDTSEIRFAPQEGFVVVAATIDSLCDAFEAIQVELTLKGGKLGLVEVLRHDDFFEQLHPPDRETTTVWLPADNVALTIFVDIVESIVQQNREAPLVLFASVVVLVVVACGSALTEERRPCWCVNGV